MTKKTRKNSKEYIEKDIKRIENALIVSHLSSVYFSKPSDHSRVVRRASGNAGVSPACFQLLLFDNALGLVLRRHFRLLWIMLFVFNASLPEGWAGFSRRARRLT